MYVFIHFTEQPSTTWDPDAKGPREVLFNLAHAPHIQTLSSPNQPDVLQLLTGDGYPLATPQVVGAKDFLNTAYDLSCRRDDDDTPLVFPFHHPTPEVALAPPTNIFDHIASLSPAVLVMMRQEQGAKVTEVFHQLSPVPTYSSLTLDSIAKRLSRAGHAVLTLPQPDF